MSRQLFHVEFIFLGNECEGTRGYLPTFNLSIDSQASKQTRQCGTDS